MLKLSFLYFALKLFTVVFVNILIYFILHKNDKSLNYARASSIYNFRHPDIYEYISDTSERPNVFHDIRFPARQTEMERRVYNLQSHPLYMRLLLFGESFRDAGNYDDVGLRISKSGNPTSIREMF